ncbi:hypothetical protein D0867_02373 [Hortaea werneckii]|uniref:Major facilitator superfamily (MFS) profile domain-containing protein n=1 Tax=Hortaea werneckii TaxID=91943 RepID=A0A3M7A687_HORWE|nr:MFS general substrate transporter [Hortaea werneckii]KAI7007403.1 MFS general substrate transporter [Hortaea werneckii]RMY22947.1 hypothetical protein D0867_02373 [Hortaea werneckii]RMY32959.1 hypothetical protein D0866_06249 [Hortaea werneckii]
MFGFHKRQRSLIPVKKLDRMDEKEAFIEHEVEIDEGSKEHSWTRGQQRNMVMIYLLFLAEAIMASSLSSQVAVLLPAAEGCLGMSASFLNSAFECAYFLGCTAGVFWGWMADRVGRRQTALLGLSGMCLCCLSMGFAKSFVAFAVLRLMAGCISSAVTVAGLAMMADMTHGESTRTRVVARLPMIAACGGVGSYIAKAVRNACANHAAGVFSKYPGLSGQIVCVSLVLLITIAEAMLIQETLPQKLVSRKSRNATADPEKAAFLGQSLSNESEDSLNISIVEALNDDAAEPVSAQIGVFQLLSAPAVLLLLASFSILSLHSSTFDILLPHLGHTDSRMGGMSIPCPLLRPVELGVKIAAALRIMTFIPGLVDQVGLLAVYRKISLVFPVLFVVVPIAGAAIHAAGASPVVSAIISGCVMLAKNILAGAAEVLVVLLVLSAAPDASSTGTVIGVISFSQIFKALAVGISGVAYYLGGDYSVFEVNILLWTTLATVAAIGAWITWKLREKPRVGGDIPEECLVWQGFFDSESDEEGGF